jgi:glutathione-regulated potassium-efflux system ancillary protein KefC
MLEHAAIFLAAAVLAVPLMKRLGLGSVIGYLAAGVAIGPSGLGFIDDVESTLHFAEFGVVLLLFLIGLELQPSRLWRLRAAVFGLGGAQVIATAAAIAAIATALGVAWQAALVIGVGLAMSSTAFAMQVLGEKKELGTPHGKAAFGVLLFQDLAAIPVLALVPLLGDQPAENARSPWITYAIGIGAIVALVVVGRLVLRPAFRFIAQAKSHELSVASALLVVIATAVLMETIGLSMALGAFIAGVLLADSEYRHELEANIEPFKGLLLGLFFIAVGMSADLGVLLARPVLVIALAIGLVALKLVVLWLLGRAFGQDRRSAASLGVAISQGGELAFVIFGAATGARWIGKRSSSSSSSSRCRW